jgi:hypothetical protein
MKFSNRTIISWQNYKALELIPDAIPAPPASKPALNLGLSQIWRSLLDELVREHVYEQRTEYLERCWNLNFTEPQKTTQVDQLRQLLALMN